MLGDCEGGARGGVVWYSARERWCLLLECLERAIVLLEPFLWAQRVSKDRSNDEEENGQENGVFNTLLGTILMVTIVVGVGAKVFTFAQIDGLRKPLKILYRAVRLTLYTVWRSRI